MDLSTRNNLYDFTAEDLVVHTANGALIGFSEAEINELLRITGSARPTDSELQCADEVMLHDGAQAMKRPAIPRVYIPIKLVEILEKFPMLNGFLYRYDLRLIKEVSHTYLRFVGPHHYFFRENELNLIDFYRHPLITFPLLTQLIEEFNNNQVFAVEPITFDDRQMRWAEAGFFSINLGINDRKDAVCGFDPCAHLHTTMPTESVDRSSNPYLFANLDYRVFNELSHYLACKNCGFLTCCGGFSNCLKFPAFRCRHIKGCSFINMIKRLDYFQLFALCAYINKETGFYTTCEREATPFSDKNWIHRKLFYRNYDEIEQTLLIANALRYNVYKASDGETMEAIPNTIVRDEMDAVYEENHIFRRIGIKKACFECLNRDCPFFAICTRHEHYFTGVGLPHKGARPPKDFHI